MTKAIRNRVKKLVVSASYKELKSLLRTNVLNDVTCALFLVSFSQLTVVKKPTENGTAVMSLRKFLCSNDFSAVVRDNLWVQELKWNFGQILWQAGQDHIRTSSVFSRAKNCNNHSCLYETMTHKKSPSTSWTPFTPNYINQASSLA